MRGWDTHATTSSASVAAPGPSPSPPPTAEPSTELSTEPSAQLGAAPPVGPEAAAPPATAPAGTFRLGYRPELDGLRGVALVTVLAYHFGVLLWPDGNATWMAPAGGQVGLDLFFALSGFLITALLLGEHGRSGRVDVPRFLWRRVLRLVPALVVLMAGLLAVSVVGERYGPDRLLASAGWVLTFTTNLAIERPIPELGHTWSLSIEAHFYLLWCLVVALVTARARRPHLVLAVLAGAGVLAVAIARAIVFANGGNAFHMYVSSAYRLDGLLVGALAGVALAAGWLDRVPPRAAGRATAVALVLFGVAAYRSHPVAPAMFWGGYTAVGLCGAVAVAGSQLAGPGPIRRALAGRPLVGLGRISYSVYLWHLPLFVWLDRNAGLWPIAVKALVAATGALVVGWLSYRLVEQPFLRRKARSAPPVVARPAPAPAPAPSR